MYQNLSTGAAFLTSTVGPSPSFKTSPRTLWLSNIAMVQMAHRK